MGVMMVRRSLRLATLGLFVGVGGGCSEGIDDGPGTPKDTAEEDTDRPEYVAPTVSSEAVYTATKTEGVVYGQGLVGTDWGAKPGTPKDLMLDLWEPEGTDGTPRPALVLIHGGGFTSGTRENGAIVRLCEYFAERGWVTASISYRLAGSTGLIPESWNTIASGAPNANQVRAMYLAARDAKAAVRWVTANAELLNVDIEQVAVGGGSAGAYTAVAVGVSGAVDFRDELSAEEDETLSSTNLDAPQEVQAVLDFWGGPGIPLIAEYVDGQSRFDREDAAMAIIHGTEDSTVSYENATNLVSLYEESGAPYELFPLEGEGHAAWGAKIEGQTLAGISFDFLVQHQGLNLVE